MADQGDSKSSTRTSERSGFAETIAQQLPPEGVEGAEAAPAEALPVGTARYEVFEEIGRGGMGRVLAAHDRQFSRVVALKQLRADRGGAHAVQRMTVEALVTGNLEHPGIPAVYERGVDDQGVPFYAMRRVRGRTLAEALASATNLADRLKLVPILIKVAQTIGFAHEHHVVHRDLKPENILIGRHGEAFVLDWGIAKVRGLAALTAPTVPRGKREPADSLQHTSQGSVLGTPAYMAPEQAAGKVDLIDERTDVFALGALLYHLLAGHAPYVAGDITTLIEQAEQARSEPLERVARAVPRGLREICERAMAREPAQRYQTAGQLAGALEAYEANALAGREGGMVGAVVSVTSWAVFALFVFGVFAMWRFLPTLHEMGQGAQMTLLIAAAGSLLSVIEWVTRGRHHTGPVALAFALATLCVGLGTTATGVGQVLAGALTPEVFADPEEYRDVVTNGLREAVGGLGMAAMLASIQFLLWALARRRVALTRERG